MSRVVIYTDGACKGNPGPGGWGVYLRYGDTEKDLCGGDLQTTNNRMELQAVIEALRALNRPCQIDFFLDSEYVRKGITDWMRGWKARGWRTADKKPVKNEDLWRVLDELLSLSGHGISWHWVKGHSGHVENERVDDLARAEAEKFRDGAVI